jgi:acetyl esterase/lipase
MRHLTILIMCCVTGAVAAEDFWAHRIGTTVGLAYGDDPQQVMDLHVHGDWIGEPSYFEPDTTPRRTLVWIHGGGWLQGDKGQDTLRITPFLERGWNVFNLNYRQGPDTAPQAVDDVMCGYRQIVEQLTEMGQPVDRIVVAGLSAGGHLALTVALLNSGGGEHDCQADAAPWAVVNWFGITDIELVDAYLAETSPEQNYARTWAGSEARVAEISADYSPMYLISGDAPPIITIHGTDDTVVPYDQAESFHSSLNTPNLLHTVRGGKHLGFTDSQFQDAYRAIFAFLDEQ